MGINMKNLILFSFSLLFLSCASNKPIEAIAVIPTHEVAKLEAKSESRFEIVRELPYFKEAIKIADCVMELKEFQNDISKIVKFGNTADSGIQVLAKMLLPAKAKLRHYRPLNFKSSVTAYTVKDEVYFNSRKHRSVEENVSTMIHERLHVLGYKHVSKWNVGRDVDNAYMIGKLSEKYVEKCK